MIVVLERHLDDDRPTRPHLVVPELYPALVDPDATERRYMSERDIAAMMFLPVEER